FAAVDRGDADEVRRIGTSEVQPLFRQVRSTVGTQASEHRNQAAVQLVALRQQTSIMAVGVPLVFVIGLAMAAMLAVILRRYRHDLDAQRRQAVHDSRHDGLTGLPNRELLTDRLAAVRSSPGCTGLVLLDLDRFKDINEALGHRYGDQLLTRVGPRLR